MALDAYHFMMSPMEFVLSLFGICLLAGFFGSLGGLVGGIIVVTALTLIYGIDIRYAIGASIVSVIATSSGAAAALCAGRNGRPLDFVSLGKEGMWGGPARDCNGCAEEWIHLWPALLVPAKRMFNGLAQFRVGPPQWTNQPVQKRQHSLGRRRPCSLVSQVVRRLQPTEKAVLGLTDDRLLHFGKNPPFLSPARMSEYGGSMGFRSTD